MLVNCCRASHKPQNITITPIESCVFLLSHVIYVQMLSYEGKQVRILPIFCIKIKIPDPNDMNET